MNYAKFEAIDQILDTLRYRLLSPVGPLEEDFERLRAAITAIGMSPYESRRRDFVHELEIVRGRKCQVCSAYPMPGMAMRLIYKIPEDIANAPIQWDRLPENVILACPACEREHSEENKIDFSHLKEVLYGQN